MKWGALLIAMLPVAALASSEPDTVTKIEALKLAYELNGKSMTRWGSIDLSGPPPEVARKGDRVIPLIDPKKKKDR